MADDKVCRCGHHRTVHVGLTEQSRCTQCHCDTFKVTDERQPNTELREWTELCKAAKCIYLEVPESVAIDIGNKIQAYHDAVNQELASIQEEAQQPDVNDRRIRNQRGEIARLQELHARASEEIERLKKRLAETRIELESAEERGDEYKAALAEARRQAFREAEEAIPKVGEMPKHVHPGFCPICDKFYARKAALEECAAAIHNRFCGENGEPCQVCRLKAEREEANDNR